MLSYYVSYLISSLASSHVSDEIIVSALQSAAVTFSRSLVFALVVRSLFAARNMCVCFCVCESMSFFYTHSVNYIKNCVWSWRCKGRLVVQCEPRWDGVRRCAEMRCKSAASTASTASIGLSRTSSTASQFSYQTTDSVRLTQRFHTDIYIFAYIFFLLLKINL